MGPHQMLRQQSCPGIHGSAGKYACLYYTGPVYKGGGIRAPLRQLVSPMRCDSTSRLKRMILLNNWSQMMNVIMRYLPSIAPHFPWTMEFMPRKLPAHLVTSARYTRS